MLKAVFSSLLSVVYPQDCRNCGNIVELNENGIACADCWAKTRIYTGGETLCDKCGVYLSEFGKPERTWCRACDGHYYDAACAAGTYEHALAASVVQLKTTPVLPGKIRFLLTSAYERSRFRSPTLIVPVPLSRKRRLERGFNQAEVLAGVLSSKTGISVDNRSLVRKFHTPVHRAAMDKKAREKTVKNAFEVRRRAMIEGQTVLLVDDVFTSGATASSCAEVLKKCGAASVYVLTLARAARIN